MYIGVVANNKKAVGMEIPPNPTALFFVSKINSLPPFAGYNRLLYPHTYNYTLSS